MAWTLAEADWLDRLHVWLDSDQGIAIWITALATVVIAAGVVIAWFAIQDAKKTRHAQLVLALDARWTSPDITSAAKLYDSYTKDGLADLIEVIFDPAKRATGAPSPGQLSDYEALSSVADLIETTGALCDDGAITRDVIYNVWGGPIVDIWRAWEIALPKIRALRDEKDIFRNFDDLGRAMNARLPESKS